MVEEPGTIRSQTPEGQSRGSATALLRDGPTRWNSTFILFERALELKEAIALLQVNLCLDYFMFPNVLWMSKSSSLLFLL